jgi:signal transduction histidine kinase
MYENNLRLFDPRKSSVWRLTLAFAAITAVTLLLAITLIYQLLLGEQSRQVERRLDAEKTRIEALASEFDKQSFFQQLDVFRSEGDVLIFWQSDYEQSQQLSFLPDNIPSLPETVVFPVLDTGRGQIRLLTTGKVKTVYGNIVLATATEHLQRLIIDFKSIASWTFILAIALTGLFGYLFSRRHLRRVNYFNATAEQVQNGNLSARLSHKDKGDEFDRLAAHINTMLDAVEENFALVQGITDNIAHDLKTPLTRLKLNLEQRLQKLPEMGYELEQLNSIINTFDAMLKLTRLEHGQFPLQLETIDSSQLANDISEILQPSAEQNGQSIDVAISSSWQLSGDRNLLFQAIFNLVENAIKYAGKGATIKIIIAEKSISVVDNGKGVNEHDLQQLTKRFYRSDPARQKEGFGLGLATVQAICNRHSLNLFLSSENGFCAKITED